eukprot:TRINITY_DN5983_c0_g1_i2.p1 TRINITY_DN5983_c0_g1~~TRINITY_DN5983_c0_g1_i2.p1  ORF type:complete len:603 (-),score=134.78 TRINITY_DN5983_c0_g1_i2:226-2034(-)
MNDANKDSILPPQWCAVLSPDQMRKLNRENTGSNLLKKFTAVCGKYSIHSCVCLAIIILEAYTEQIPSKLYRQLFDEALPKQDMELVVSLAGKLFGMMILSSGLGVVQNYFATKVGEGVASDLRQSLYRHLSQMPFHFFTILRSGDFVSLFNSELSTASHALGTTIPRMFHNLFSAIFGFYTLYSIEPGFAVLIFLIIPVFQLPSKYFGNKLKALRREEINTRAEMNNTLQDYLSVQGMLLARTFGNNNHGNAKFAEANTKLNAMGLKRTLFSATFMQVLAFSVSLSTGIVYTFGSALVIKKGLTVGKIMAFANQMHRVYGPLTELSNVQVEYRSISICFGRLFSYLSLPVEKSGNQEKLLELTDVVGQIKFCNVSFQYPRSLFGDDLALQDIRCVIKDINFEVQPGEKLVIVGANGAGKTSVAQLLARLYAPNEGHIEVDGHDIRKISPTSYTKMVGFLSQDTFLLNDTISNNLRYAMPDASDEDLLQACKEAGLEALLDSLPQGLNTIVGERAFALSLGERQKLSLARIILRNFKIVILDEFSSNLDPTMELEVWLETDEDEIPLCCLLTVAWVSFHQNVLTIFCFSCRRHSKECSNTRQ